MFHYPKTCYKISYFFRMLLFLKTIFCTPKVIILMKGLFIIYPSFWQPSQLLASHRTSYSWWFPDMLLYHTSFPKAILRILYSPFWNWWQCHLTNFVCWFLYFFGIGFGYANQRIVREIRIDTFFSILKQDIGFFDGQTSGELASRLNSDCGEMAGDTMFTSLLLGMGIDTLSMSISRILKVKQFFT